MLKELIVLAPDHFRENRALSGENLSQQVIIQVWLGGWDTFRRQRNSSKRAQYNPVRPSAKGMRDAFFSAMPVRMRFPF
jgi:hypothetical protein